MAKCATERAEWREFEVAVSRLEALLRPRGYVFKSPDKLRDNDTGELREVDCSITHAASGEVISLECRKRRKRQDVLWIEQLVCKRDSLGLAGTIAVSSTGFSKAAQTKAQKRGILLKTYQEVADPSFLVDTKDGLRLRHLVQRGTIRGSTLMYSTDDDEPDLDAQRQAQVVAAIEGDADDAVLLRDARTGEEVTMRRLVKACLAQLAGEPVRAFSKRCHFEFPPRTVALAPVDIPVHVKTVSFVLDVDVTVQPMKLPSLVRYEGGRDVTLHVASAESQTAERGPMRLEFVFSTSDASG